MTKSQQVRDMIAQAKAAGLTQVDLILDVMAKFNFNRQLARTYINSNWDRVEAAAPQAAAPRVLSMTPSAIRKREARKQARMAALRAKVEAIEVAGAAE